MDLTVFGSILFSDEQARLDRGVNQLPLLPAAAHARGDETIASSADALGEATFHAALPSPTMNHSSRRNLLSVYGLDDMSMEELRAVRTALQPEIADAPNNIVLVTGATPGTGKSFVSANLAVVLAETGKQVLLIDGDLRRGHLAAAFGQPSEGGMAEVLTGQLEWKEAIRSVNVNGLSFISTGQYPSNPSELLSTPRMRQLLEQFSRQFDLVIIDTPPVLAVTDANIIAPHAGSTVLVVRPNAQTERELEETFRRLDRAGARVIGAIFNAAARRRSEKRTYQYASLYAAAAAPQHGEA